MPRRKQANPRVHIGPVGQRNLPSDNAEDAHDLALEEWEEQNAYISRRGKKNRKKQSDRKLLQIHHTIYNLHLASLSLTHVAERPIQASLRLIEQSTSCSLQLQDDGILLADSFQIPVGDATVASALFHLLCGNYLLLGNLQCTPLTVLNDIQEVKISIGLVRDRVFQTTATAADDQLHRPYHTHLLTILRWLMPFCRLDPYNEPIDSTANTELASSPLCSPRGKSSKSLTLLTAGDDTMHHHSLCDAEPHNNDPCDDKDALLLRTCHEESSSVVEFDAVELYAAVKPIGNEPQLSIHTPQLKPALRGYQKRAVQWMIARETSPPPLLCLETGRGMNEQLHPLWREVLCSTPTTAASPSSPAAVNNSTYDCFYINAYTGLVSLTPFYSMPPPRGGVAADEMGLGKTVEMLALIAAHPYQGDDGSEEEDAGKAAHHARHQRHCTTHGMTTMNNSNNNNNNNNNANVSCIDCVCGATDDFDNYQGLWLFCEDCRCWLHGVCVGHSRKGPKGDFICGKCLKQRASRKVTRPCGTTLIICPEPILPQWAAEIERHMKENAFKVLIYRGQQQPGSTLHSIALNSTATAASYTTTTTNNNNANPPMNSSLRVVTAADLAHADIVLTTFDVLRKDLHRCPSSNGHQQTHALRKRKRYEVVPTPLTRLTFWRVIIDEAQLVESSTAKAAEMALKLQTVHRWCVSGTPLSRGLEDLHGLMAFLRVDPYQSRYWWMKCIQKPYDEGNRSARARLLALLKPSLGGLLWRSSKDDVKNELGLPDQRHHLTHLRFSAVENFFYARQHQECIGAAKAALSASTLASAQAAASLLSIFPSPVLQEASCNGSTQQRHHEQQHDDHEENFVDRPLTQREEHKLIHPLLRLRQACVHSQVGSAGIRALSSSNRKPMKQAEVLSVLISNQQIEAEAAQRALVASLNGLAGLFLLGEGGAKEAIRAYREVLKTVEDNKEYIRVDKLQKLHTVHNLAELLSDHSNLERLGIGRTLRESVLKEEAASLKGEYLAEHVAKLAKAEKEMEEAWEGTRKIKEALYGSVGHHADELLHTWWIAACNLIAQNSSEIQLATIVEDIKRIVDQDDFYARQSEKNATNWASRFSTMHGLQQILTQECRAVESSHDAAMRRLNELQQLVQSPSQSTVEMAASCMKCRAETRRIGTMCHHCTLDQLMLHFEVRLFYVNVNVTAKEKQRGICVESAIEAMRLQALHRVGRGGLGEDAALLGYDVGGGEGGRGGGMSGGWNDAMHSQRNIAGDAKIIHRPSMVQRALKMLLDKIRTLSLDRNTMHGDVSERDMLIEVGKAHLEVWNNYSKEFLKANALILAQRLKLYAIDELDQCLLRMTLRAPDEIINNELEGLFKIHEAEIPVKNAELSAEKAVAQAQLTHALGKLRYLMSLKQKYEHQQQNENTQTTNNSSNEEEGLLNNSEDDVCPVCHDILGQRESAMLLCGHRLCCDCMLALEKRMHVVRGSAASSPSATAHKVFPCPSCRTRVKFSDVAFIEPTVAANKERPLLEVEVNHPMVHDGSVHQHQQAGDTESKVPLLESTAIVDHTQNTTAKSYFGDETVVLQEQFSTKLDAVVCRLIAILKSDPYARILVFSGWKDALDIVSYALKGNQVMHLYPKGPKQFQEAIARFRADHDLMLKHQRDMAMYNNELLNQEGGSMQEGVPNTMGSMFGNGLKEGPFWNAVDDTTPRILLMVTKQGGNGLNLQQAQHVVFIEALLDPAEEAQAIGRIDRIGQQHATHIHRFVVVDTVEENVHHLVKRRAAAMDLAAAAVRRGKSVGDGKMLTVKDVALLLMKKNAQ